MSPCADPEGIAIRFSISALNVSWSYPVNILPICVPDGHACAVVPLKPRVTPVNSLFTESIPVYKTISAVDVVPIVARFGAAGNTLTSVTGMEVSVDVMAADSVVVGDSSLAGYMVGMPFPPSV
jgi:hypothetical protein